jgi:ATP-dependent helicase IRC3
LLRSARWRQQPASESQKQFISKRWKVTVEDPLLGITTDGKSTDTHSRIEKMTKGEAGNIITRLKHGAQVRKIC